MRVVAEWSNGESTHDAGEDGLGFVDDLTPGHTHDAESAGHEIGIAAAIVFETAA
jgi:hypothetical protein